jgi:hypothetical protein
MDNLMLNYFALFIVSVVGIVVFDDDPAGVSPQEWIFFAVMIYAAINLLRLFQQYLRDSNEWR